VGKVQVKADSVPGQVEAAQAAAPAAAQAKQEEQMAAALA